MLAITGMPVADGSLLSAPIVLVANTADPANTLTITLDDTNSLNPGVVVATISNGSVTRNVWNFSGITFTGTFDTPGDILNTVSITSRYGFSLTADPGSTGNFYAWRSVADFTPVTLPDVQIDLENVDVLSLAAPLGPTSIVGTFETPTMIPAAPRGQIAIASNTGIEVGAAGVKVYDLSLDNNHAATASAISFLGAVTAKNDLTIRDSNTITVSQPLSAGRDLQISTIKSPGGSGDIFVNAALKAQAGDVSLIAVDDIEVKAAVESVLGGIKIDADDELLIDAKLKAQDGIALVGDTKITLTAAADLLADTGSVTLASVNGSITTDGVITTLNTGGVTFNASTNLTANTVVTSAAGNIVLDSANGNVVSTKALLAKAGDITLTATLGNVTTTADVEATAGSVAVKAGLAASLTKVTAFKTIAADAGTDVTLTKAVTVTGAPPGTGLVKVTANAGNLLQQVQAPITVVDGKIELRSVAGTVSLNSLVQSNLEIGINAGRGIALDNAVDLTAAVRTTGVDGTITIKSDANAIVINAPVTSQADAIEVLSVNGPIDVRDDMSALLDLSITGKTTVTAHSVPDFVMLTSQTGTLTLESTAANVVIASDVTLVAAPGALAGIALLAATTVTAPIVLKAQGDITIQSPDGYTVTNSITSNLGTIAIKTAAGPLTSILAPLTAGKNISLVAAGPVTIDNQLKTTTGGINLQSTGASVSIAPTAAIVAPHSAGGTLTIDAGTFITLGIPLLVGNDITVVTGATFIPSTDITTTNGSISITSTTGNLDVSGITLSAVGGTPPNFGSAFLSAVSGTLTVGLNKILLNPGFGSLTLIASNLVGFGGLAYTLGGSLTVQTGNPIVPAIGEDLESMNGDINLRSTGGNVDVSNIDVKAKLGSIKLESDAANVIVGTNAFLVSPTIHGLPTPPWPANPGQITLRAGGTVLLNQPLKAANTITIDSTNTYLLEHNLVSDFADVSVTSTAGDILIDDSAGKATLIAAEITTGTITLSANGVIDHAATPGNPITAKVHAQNLKASALGLSGFRFTNPLNDVDNLTVTLPSGTGITFTDVDDLTILGGLVTATGDITVTTLGGDLTIKGPVLIGGPAPNGVTLTSASNLSVGGAINAGPTGEVTLAAALDISVGGAVSAAPTKSITVTAGAAIKVTDNILAGKNVTLTAGSTTGGLKLTNGFELNGADILAGTGDITLLQVGSVVADGILIDGDMTAVLGSISVKTDSNINFTGGEIIANPIYTPGLPAVGLVTLEAPLGITMTAGANIIAGRLEVVSVTSATSDLVLTGAVSSLKVVTTKSLTFTNAIPLTLTDFDNKTPSIQIDAFKVSISSPLGLDVIDGIAHKGTLSLSASPTISVRFFPTSPGDNFFVPTFKGTLRDHLNYVSANLITTQPMAVLASLPSTPLSLSGVVTLEESLPIIRNAVLLDGALAPVDPIDPTVSIGGILGIDGSMIAPAVGAHGLTLAAGSSGSHIRNAAIYGFDSGTGIRVESSNNLIEALLIGQDRDGVTSTLTANNVGIDLSGPAAARNVIGVQTVGVDAGNVIVNSNEAGILVRAGADFASIFGNFVGTDRTGAALGNRGDGIVIEDTIGTLVGGVDTVLGNAVSNSGRNGILVQDVSASLLPYGARIIGNTIDDNAEAGVRVLGGRNNVIGGAQFGAGNRFSGNEDGIVLGSSLTAVTHSNLIEGNFVAASGVDGIRIEYGWNNTVNGNESTGNGAAGIRLFRTVAFVGACVSCGTSGPNRDSNRVTRNVVRNNGATPLTGGIVLEYASGQSIGGDPSIALGNEAYDNVGSGIVVLGGQGADLSRGNRIQGNYLGGNAAGSLLAPNQGDGIRIQGGIVTAISQNTVWASLGSGIAVENSLASNSQQANVLTRNTVTGSQQGIRVSGGSWHQIGSAVDGQGNAVFGNLGDGIVVEGSAGMGPAARVFVRGNRVGLDTSNVPSPNNGFGIRITDSNSIVVDSNNVVRHNVNGGVLVEGGTGTTVGSPQASRYENRFYRGLSIVKPFQANVISMNGGPGITIANPANPATPLAVTSKLNVVGNVIELNSGDGVRVEGERVNGVIVGRRPTVGRPDGDGNTIRNNASGGVVVDASRNVTIIGNQVIGNGPLNTKQIALLNGGNDGVSPPSITSVTPRTTHSATPQYDVVGRVQGTAGQRFFVDFYGNQNATGTQVYLGRVLATIRNGSTMASFRYLATARGVSGGFNSISVTATVAATLVGGTSEFVTEDT